MKRSVINLIAVAERRGYADVPPGSIDDQIESELAAWGYGVSTSDRLWLGGQTHTRVRFQQLGVDAGQSISGQPRRGTAC